MKEYTIDVTKQAERFYLAFDHGWVESFGHLVTVDDFEFSAIPIMEDETPKLIVSELKSGAKLFKETPPFIKNHDAFMNYLEIRVAVRIVRFINTYGEEEMRKQINQWANKARNSIGEKPSEERLFIDVS